MPKAARRQRERAHPAERYSPAPPTCARSRSSEFGGPEVLELVDLPMPEPAEDEVLIEVSRAGLNYADTHQRQNAYLAKAELPLMPGAEVAGVREDTGERVVALVGDGGYAQYATAPAALTFPIPDGVDDGQALALLRPGPHRLPPAPHERAVQPGETVVVHAAAGGVGSLAVQLAKPLGAGRVIATASSEEKRALALELGADAATDAEPEGHGGAADRGQPRRARRRGARDGRAARSSSESMAGARAVRALRDLRDRHAAAQRGADRVADARLRAAWSASGSCTASDRPAMIDEALADLFERRPARASCASWSARPIRSPRRRARRWSWPSGAPRASCCSTPRLSASFAPDRSAELGLSEPLLQALRDVGYENPSPIQVQAIPPLLEGRDVIGQAQTGTGKTAAFGLPLLEYVDVDDPRFRRSSSPRRASCASRSRRPLRAYGARKGVEVVAVFGGAPIRTQQAQLKGAQVVVGTVGRVLDLISRHSLMLHDCRYVVLDEADEMLDLGFLEDVERILQLTPGPPDRALLGHHPAARSGAWPTATCSTR